MNKRNYKNGRITRESNTLCSAASQNQTNTTKTTKLTKKLPAARSYDFVIIRMITDRIGLHLVLLPLRINLLFEVLNLPHCSFTKALTFPLVWEKRRDQTHLEIVTHFKTNNNLPCLCLYPAKKGMAFHS